MATSYLDIEGLRRFYQIISGRIATKLPVVAKTKSEWQTSGGVISEAGVLYIITDYKTIQRDNDTYNVPAFKLGDGQAYIIDLPCATVDEETFFNHVNDRVVHITQAERQFWNNKNRCEIDEDDPECLVITIN